MTDGDVHIDEVPKWYALRHTKCARCRQGNMFKPGFLSQKMYNRCSSCGLYFERNPGYFYVAMFVSYALAVAEILIMSIITFILSGGSENVYIYLGIILATVILLSPINFKYSRVLQMYFLDPALKYHPKLAGKAYPETRKERMRK